MIGIQFDSGETADAVQMQAFDRGPAGPRGRRRLRPDVAAARRVAVRGRDRGPALRRGRRPRRRPSRRGRREVATPRSARAVATEGFGASGWLTAAPVGDLPAAHRYAADNARGRPRRAAVSRLPRTMRRHEPRPRRRAPRRRPPIPTPPCPAEGAADAAAAAAATRTDVWRAVRDEVEELRDARPPAPPAPVSPEPSTGSRSRSPRTTTTRRSATPPTPTRPSRPSSAASTRARRRSPSCRWRLAVDDAVGHASATRTSCGCTRRSTSVGRRHPGRGPPVRRAAVPPRPGAGVGDRARSGPAGSEEPALLAGGHRARVRRRPRPVRPVHGALQAGVPDGTRLVLRGSAVQGASYKTGEPFDARGPGTSDLDIVLLGDEAMAAWEPEAFYLPGVNTQPLYDDARDIATRGSSRRARAAQEVGGPAGRAAGDGALVPRPALRPPGHAVRRPRRLTPARGRHPCPRRTPAPRLVQHPVRRWPAGSRSSARCSPPLEPDVVLLQEAIDPSPSTGSPAAGPAPRLPPAGVERRGAHPGAGSGATQWHRPGPLARLPRG